MNDLFYNLPKELQIEIYTYDTTHRKKFCRVVEAIQIFGNNCVRCDNCKKIIRGEAFFDNCCSIVCTTEYLEAEYGITNLNICPQYMSFFVSFFISFVTSFFCFSFLVIPLVDGLFPFYAT